MRRHGGFPHWIRSAAGLHRDEAVIVDVERGAALPARDGFAGIIVTGSGAMVTDRHDWSERSAAWLGDAAHAGTPVFGICYGHQLLAHALGGEVGDNPNGREMGTVEIDVHAQAENDPLSPDCRRGSATRRRIGRACCAYPTAPPCSRRRRWMRCTHSAGDARLGACSSIPNSPPCTCAATCMRAATC